MKNSEMWFVGLLFSINASFRRTVANSMISELIYTFGCHFNIKYYNKRLELSKE
jgi:hypothetical protein